MMICEKWKSMFKDFFSPILDFFVSSLILLFDYVEAFLTSWFSVTSCPAGRRQDASQSLSALITAVTLLGRSLCGSNQWWPVTQNQPRGGSIKDGGEKQWQQTESERGRQSITAGVTVRGQERNLNNHEEPKILREKELDELRDLGVLKLGEEVDWWRRMQEERAEAVGLFTQLQCWRRHKKKKKKKGRVYSPSQKQSVHTDIRRKSACVALSSFNSCS